MIRRMLSRAKYNNINGRALSTKKKPLPGDEVLVCDTPIISKIDDDLVPPVPEFDKKLISYLEKLSLVRFTDEEAVAHLRKAVFRANRLQLVDVENVEPMLTVWENQDCPLHDDIPEEPLSIKEVFANAKCRVEDYFVTPPGNVPLEESTKPLDLELINQWDTIGVPSKPEPRQRKINDDS